MAQYPTSRELVNDRLDGRLVSYLRRQRGAGKPVRWIVDDIHNRTDVLVTERTVWRWIKEDQREDT